MPITFCKDCQYWKRLVPEGPEGSCRAAAPDRLLADVFASADATARRIYFRDGQLHLAAVWPITVEDDFCGFGLASGGPVCDASQPIRLKMPRSDSAKLEALRAEFAGSMSPGWGKRHRGELSGKIADWLAAHGRPATRQQILAGVGGNPNSLTTTLGTMKRRGQLVHARGMYAVRPNDTAPQATQ